MIYHVMVRCFNHAFINVNHASTCINVQPVAGEKCRHGVGILVSPSKKSTSPLSPEKMIGQNI